MISRWRRWGWTLCLLLLCPLAWAAAGDYGQVTGPCDLHFPRDHADHPAFRTEWWYYTGHLTADDGARFGFQLTFFRYRIAPPAERQKWPEPASAWRSDQVYLAHAAVTDVAAGRHLSAERSARAALGLAGVADDDNAVEIKVNNWSARIAPTLHRLEADGGEFAFELELMPRKPATRHGIHGYSRKGDTPSQASCYYSFTRLAARGQLKLGGRFLDVSGQAWMDHEFSTAPLAEGLVGWDWFSLQLDDQRELMLFVLRRGDGTWHPASSGTLILPDGTARHLTRDEIDLKTTRHWRSPHSQAVYPAGWLLQVGDEIFQIKPLLDDQEMRTGASTGVTYWEGAVNISAADGKSLKGSGYVELTGYAGAFDAPI
ncbi:MAG: carotenoid 1,2-hydratase [Deltaproteobacteria bacterium]|nr:carotenoid 1,2-hydratase [Deltaproteobacteria bacterium]